MVDPDEDLRARVLPPVQPPGSGPGVGRVRGHCLGVRQEDRGDEDRLLLGQAGSGPGYGPGQDGDHSPHPQEVRGFSVGTGRRGSQGHGRGSRPPEEV